MQFYFKWYLFLSPKHLPLTIIAKEVPAFKVRKFAAPVYVTPDYTRSVTI